MTRNKDLKTRIRARMQKTGESYTAARRQLLTKRSPEAPPPLAGRPSPTPPATGQIDAALAGMSDAAVAARTGRDWASWVEQLDSDGASNWTHREIARHLHDRHGVGAWWTQAVTVGYERIKGLRAVGQRRGDRSFETNKSRTFAVPVAQLFRAWADARRRKRWLDETGLTVRSQSPERSLRLTWNDGTSVELWFVAKSATKSAVQIQHRKLPSKAAADARRVYWTARLTALAEQLEGA